MRREDYVLDTWHNSGASPYARFTDDQFGKFVPTDFLTEGIDQTRGWANSLLLEYVILTGKPESPYRAFLFQGLTQDARGRKMSKSLGNVVENQQAPRKEFSGLVQVLHDAQMLAYRLHEFRHARIEPPQLPGLVYAVPFKQVLLGELGVR
jgi:isoleucyl-tRNA synthetase